MAKMEMQAPWSRNAKYTPFFVTGMDLTSVFITTPVLVLNLPSPAAMRPVDQTVGFVSRLEQRLNSDSFTRLVLYGKVSESRSRENTFGKLTDQLVTIRFPRWRFLGSHVELVVK